MTRLIANRDLYNPGEYGRVKAGQEFVCRPSTAEKLVKQGTARRIVYEMPPLTPEHTGVQTLNADAFRLVFVPDQEPAAVAAEGDRLLPVADVRAKGTADRRKRKRRKASDSE